MGNTRSQLCRRNKSPYLFYLIHRTWSVVIDHRRDRCDDTDKETDLSSKCSTCNDCDYRQDSLIFDSESDMAPNAEEELLVVKPWGPQPEKERLRPPTYNAEDYAIALRRWGRRPLGTVQDFQGTLPSTTSSSSGYASGSGEMTLRQFTSVSELLNKLRADLRLAFPSFVQEFASPPADGITLLLETLRGVQLAQSSPPNSGQTGPKVGTRRAALDELGCVECLAACGERCADAPRLLVQAQPGLLALAVCLTSSLNRSRVLALQLLTKVCQAPGGHAAVSEAVSTLRLKYGEGGRFRFLAGALLAPRAAIALRVAGVSFLNAFLKSAPRTQTRLYIQAEACEAGLEPQVLQEWLREFDGREEDTLTDLLHKEVQKWTHNCVDVDALQRRVMRAEETCRILSEKVSFLQMQLEKRNDRNSEERDKSTSIILTAAKSPKVSSNAEDEGISSSERSSSPEDTKHQVRTNHQKSSPTQSNDQETTIDDVIEELRIIVKDAEEEFSDKIQELNHRIVNHDQETARNEQESAKDKLYRSNSKISLNNSESYMYEKVSKREKLVDLKTLRPNMGSNAPQSQMKGEQVTYFGNDRDYSSNSSSTKRSSPNEPRRSSKSSLEGSVKIVVKGPDMEEAIVPAILHPQPPRRAPPCLSAIIAARHCDFADQAETYNSHDEEAEEETLGDGSDSLLSASRLKYNGKHQMYDEQMRSVNADQLQKQAKSDTILIDSNHTDVMSRKSLDDLHRFEKNDTKDRKILRSYEISKESKSSKMITDVRPFNKQMDIHRQFDSISKGMETSSGRSADQRRHGSKYRSEVEKRKYLRRSASHDYLESTVSSPQSRRSGSRVECRIRKFESLNSFDEHRSLQNYGRLNGSENLDKRERAMLLADFSKSKMRRSESFHHVSQHVLKRDQCSSKGESDSGLFYITDFNLEPLVARRPRSVDAPKSPSLLTKSLDRIDEGLDSMVDIVIMQEQNQWNGGKHQSKVSKSRDEKLTRSKSDRDRIRPDDLGDSSSEFNKPIKRDENSAFKNRHLKNDGSYHINNKQLKNDEFYEEQRTREWNYHNELNYARDKSEVSLNDSPVILPKNNMRHNSFCQKDNISNKFSSKRNESGIFAGRTYDTFGLGKSRFNAGKYSGNQQIKESPIGRRNTTSSLIGKRGKVTDVVSGLY